jgi:hypothetical protein
VDAKGSLSAMSDRYADRKTGLAMNTYPSISNPNFHELLQKMRELYIEKLSPSSFDKLQGRTKALLRHQQFVKHIWPQARVQRYITRSRCRVGKTCTAVAIAEMYHATMSNPVIILTGSSLKSQWRDEIAGVESSVHIWCVEATFVLCGECIRSCEFEGYWNPGRC